MKKGIIFDMDGVLIDSEYFYQKRRQEYLETKGYTKKLPLELIGSNEKEIWEILIPEDEKKREDMKMEYRVYRKNHPTDYNKILDPQVPMLLKRLHELGIKTAIASSSNEQIINEMLEATGIGIWIDYIISGEHCTGHKPNPDIYLRALKGLLLDANEVLAVEDSPRGIEAAKNARIYTCALLPRHGERIDQTGADQIISQLDQVLNYL